MSKFVILLVAALFAGFTAFAQDSTQPAPPPLPPKHNHQQLDPAEKRLKRLSKRLNLSDDQKEKIRPILQDEEQKRKSVEDDTAMPQQQRRKKMREIRMASKSQMVAILTPEQKEKVQAGRAGNEGRRRMHRGNQNPPNSDQSSPQ